MKKRQNNSVHASALQVSIAVALMAVSAILFASSFMAAPAARNHLSAAPQQDGFYPPLPVPAPAQQAGFYPPLPDGVGLTVSLPIDTMDVSVPISTVLIKPVVTDNID